MTDTVVSLGLDFGTESVRAVLIDIDGRCRGEASDEYRHGQIVDRLPGGGPDVEPSHAFQSPDDWIDSAVTAVRSALAGGDAAAEDVVGIGVDFTACTMLPTCREGVPLCTRDRWRNVPMAWPKLWKHHGAVEQTDRLNAVARERNEPLFERYGGTIGLEWFQPKLLETLDVAPEVADAADVWIEAGDWFVWRLVGGEADSLPRSTCQAGYKALWSPRDGYGGDDFLRAVDPRLADAIRDKMPGRMLAPGERAGVLCESMATRMGLPVGVTVSAATIDAHAAVPGVGAAEPGVLVMVMGTSSCHMINAAEVRSVPGVAGVVPGGVLPGLVGYETGQAAVGDAFAWLGKTLNRSLDELSSSADDIPPGADGVRCLDWMNGCRTPLMDGGLSGALTGLKLSTTPGHLYRALAEGSACGVRWIVETLVGGGVPVGRLVATGGLPHHNPSLVQTYADVLGRDIEIHPTTQGPAVGAAVLGMAAAGSEVSGFDSITDAAAAMANPPGASSTMVRADPERRQTYDDLYADYRRLAAHVAG